MDEILGSALFSILKILKAASPSFLSPFLTKLPVVWCTWKLVLIWTN